MVGKGWLRGLSKAKTCWNKLSVSNSEGIRRSGKLGMGEESPFWYCSRAAVAGNIMEQDRDDMVVRNAMILCEFQKIIESEEVFLFPEFYGWRGNILCFRRTTSAPTNVLLRAVVRNDMRKCVQN